ncbi:MAG TPA: hypothetical protein VF363_09710 [Candidatus Eisenbacteria bacterium]
MFAFALGAIPVAGAIVPGAARAESGRPLYVAPVFGARSFESKLDLETEAAVGARLGAGVNDRVTVWMDAIHSVPARKTTGRLVYVTALRGLAQCRLLVRSAIHPYLVAGVGGILFNFGDTTDTAGGEVTLGGGVEYRVAPRACLFGEFTDDFYRSRSVVYGSTGEEISSTPRSTDTARTFAIGLAVGL